MTQIRVLIVQIVFWRSEGGNKPVYKLYIVYTELLLPALKGLKGVDLFYYLCICRLHIYANRCQQVTVFMNESLNHLTDQPIS